MGTKPVRIVMYCRPLCGYCSAARRLLRRRGLTFSEVDIFLDPALQAEMMERTGRRTVPQIFIGETHVGGFDELHALEGRGELDQLIARVELTTTTGD